MCRRINVLIGWVVVVVAGVGFHGVDCRGGGTARRWLNAHATYYGTGLSPATLGGACGYDNSIHAGFGVHTSAVSQVMYRNGMACGACYAVRCNYKADPRWCLKGHTVTVTATNFCPPNNNGGWCDPPHHHFDMAQPSFLSIARPGNEGIIPVLYTKVSCRRSGGVRFTMRGQGNFNMVLISNLGGSGDIRSAWVKTAARGSRWTPMQRNWGANWQSSYDLRNQRLSFKITLGNHKTLALYDVVPPSWTFGQTFTSKRQF